MLQGIQIVILLFWGPLVNMMDKASKAFNEFFYIYALSMMAIVPMKVIFVRKMYLGWVLL